MRKCVQLREYTEAAQTEPRPALQLGGILPIGCRHGQHTAGAHRPAPALGFHPMPPVPSSSRFSALGSAHLAAR